MIILVVAPMVSEKNNMEAALAARTKLRNTYTVVHGQVGKVYAAAATALALEADNYEMVAVVGYAAASQAFSTGKIVCPRVARYHDVRVPEGLDGVEFLTGAYHLAGKDDATIFTGDAFVGADDIRSILGRFDCRKGLFDMEATAVCQIAAQRGVRAMVVKMISDTPERGSDADSFERFVTEHTDFGAILDILEKQ